MAELTTKAKAAEKTVKKTANNKNKTDRNQSSFKNVSSSKVKSSKNDLNNNKNLATKIDNKTKNQSNSSKTTAGNTDNSSLKPKEGKNSNNTKSRAKQISNTKPKLPKSGESKEFKVQEKAITNNNSKLKTKENLKNVDKNKAINNSNKLSNKPIDTKKNNNKTTEKESTNTPSFIDVVSDKSNIQENNKTSKNNNNSKGKRNSKNNVRNNNKNYSDKRKTLTFSFNILAPKSTNQVSLNKVKQCFLEIDNTKMIKPNQNYESQNIVIRHNHADLNNFIFSISKALLPNPNLQKIVNLPIPSMTRFKKQRFTELESKTKNDDEAIAIKLVDDIFTVNYHSKFNNIQNKSKAKEKTKENPPPIKAKKINKFEEEALNLKNEVFVLPDIDYIKYTFPELEKEKEKASKAKFIQENIRFTNINKDKKIVFSENMNPFLKEIYDEVILSLDEDFAISPGSKILLAVSAGVDSIVMLDIFAQIAEQKKLNIFVAHFNHQIRGSASDKDEATVKKVCEEYGVKCYTGSENILKYASDNSISIELSARINRYKMFERLSGNLKLDYVATAHTSDDSVETFFLNLFRGSGLTGLAGIPQKRIFYKSTYLIRPLINISKERLLKYAEIRNLNWNEDRTNLLTQYSRNKIRLELLPLIKKEYSPAISSLIERTSKLIRGADDFISNYVTNAVGSIIFDRRKDRFSISIPQLQTYSDYIQTEIIQKAISTVFNTQPISTKTIDRIINTLNAPTGSICNINKYFYAIKDRNKIIFSVKSPVNDIDLTINKISSTEFANGTLKISEIPKNRVEYTRDPNIEFIDADLLPSNLILRNWQAGDVFKPIGMEGTMKISDFFTNQKVSILDKQSVLVLSTKSEIVWILGRRLSNDFKVTANTTKVLKIEFVPAK